MQRFKASTPFAQWSSLGAALLILGALIGRNIYAEYKSVDLNERERLATQARVVDENLSRQLVATNLALNAIRSDLPYLNAQKDGKAQLDRRLQAMREAMPGMRAITLFDAAGTLLARSPNQFVGQNFSNREYFQIARQGGDPGTLYVSPPFLAATGEYVINMAKVVLDERGVFAGIILASLDPAYFSVLLASIRYAPDMRVSLVHADGKVFLTIPLRPKIMGADLAVPGSFFTRHRDSGGTASVMTGATYVAGDPSMMAFRTIQPADSAMDKALLLSVARDLPSLFSGWRRDAYRQGGLFGALTLVASLSLFYYQQRRRRYDALVASQESERKAAEAELRIAAAAFDSQESMMITDANSVILRVNQAFVRDTGFAAEEAVGQTPRLLQSGRHHADFYRAMWAAIDRVGMWQGDIWGRRKNGEEYPKWLTISAVKDGSGVVTHYIGVHFDVTERKRAESEIISLNVNLEERVRQRTAELETSNRMLSQAKIDAEAATVAKSDFLANMSHELRTPLSAVIGMAGLARGITTDPRQRDYLDKIEISGKHLSRIINDLLDLSKITAGYLEFESISFSLHALLVRCNSVMAYRMADSGLKLVETVDAAVPDVLWGDPSRIEQIILNLVGNAIKFTPNGHIEVRVSLHAREADRVGLTIEVEDTGIGMGPEALERLFKPFSQGNESVSRQYGGTGLGLTISKRLANMMGGDISVTSHEGRGSTFRVTLWLGLGKVSDLLAATEEAQHSVRVRYEDVRVLVVDDQPFNREIAEGLLAQVGIAVHLACNGQEALDLVSSGGEVFDLVLMDVHMPVMDGITATRAIRGLDEFAALPIIAMTAQTMAHERERSAAAGMNDHIGKPFDEAGFYRVLLRWISADKRRLQTAAAICPGLPSGLPRLNGIDTRAGLALLQNDEARYRRWLDDFVAEAPGAMAQIRQSIAAGISEAASMTAHTLKGRTGLLGMNGLHAVATALEAAIDGAQPTNELLLDLERGLAAMCVEIRRGLGPAENPAPAVESDEPLAEGLPPGVLPASVRQLIGRLQAGDSNCDRLVVDCLDELAHTAWASRLRQASIAIQNFDYAAAAQLLGGGQETA